MTAVAQRKHRLAAGTVSPVSDRRVSQLWIDRWVSYPRAVRVLQRMAELLALPARVRMPNMLVHGPSGVGKSMIIAKFLRDQPQGITRSGQARTPVVALQMPAMPTLRSFFSQVIRALDTPVITGSSLSELELDAVRKLEAAKPRLLIVDECHHLLACTPRDQRAALNTLKYLSNEPQISIVALGTDEALHVMRTDPQIASRFDRYALPIWAASDELRGFIAGFGEQLELDTRSIADSEVAIEYLLEITGGVTGRIVEMIRLAARGTLRHHRKKLTLEDLQSAGKEFVGDLNSA